MAANLTCVVDRAAPVTMAGLDAMTAELRKQKVPETAQLTVHGDSNSVVVTAKWSVA